MPSHGLLETGSDPEEDITPVMAGGHDGSLLWLSSGNCDVAFTHNSQLGVLEETGQVEPGTMEPIWTSGQIPAAPMTVNTEAVSPELRDAIEAILLENGNVEGLVELGICEYIESCEMPDEAEYGWIPTDNASHDIVREICAVTEADTCENVGDPALALDDVTVALRTR